MPSAEELERLTQAFQSNPASGAFVSLGEAFLSLGRPRDAIEVGATGLRANPDSIDGRIMVATAFAQLHKWKEAQAELLKVVKRDRNHARGFRLLGEVLMRRADYERALPVLQHAQNLSPADPSILGLLRRARAGQPLDPPPPIPTPLKPRGNGHRGGIHDSIRLESDGEQFEQMPTRVAGDIYKLNAQSVETYQAAEQQAALARMELERRSAPGGGAGPRAPVERPGRPRQDVRGNDDRAARPVEHHAPPPAEDPFAPLDRGGVRAPPLPVTSGAPLPASARYAPTLDTDIRPPAGSPPPTGQSPLGQPPTPPPRSSAQRPVASPPPAPQPGDVNAFADTAAAQPSVQPRMLPAQKPKGAAQSALRQSAAVGEQYLNNLLTAGLLDVPNVQARSMEFDVKPDRTWGRSTGRMFVYLFVLLVLGVGGAGGWYWYSEKQKQEDVAKLLTEAKGLVDSGDYKDLVKGGEAARSAMKLDPESNKAVAIYAENTGLQALLYREIDPSDVERAIELVGTSIKTPADVGYRELLVGRSAATLSRLHDLDEDAPNRLRDTKKELTEYLKTAPDDRMARWLYARALLAEGNLKDGKVALEQAYSRGEGPVVAGIDLADMLLDDGEFDAAMELYNKALEKSPEHLLAYSGRSLARSERSAEPDAAISDLNVGLADPKGMLVKGYKSLGLATAWLQQEDYEQFARDLDQAAGAEIDEPRFLVRVGLLRAAQGKLKQAGQARAQIKWFSQTPQEHPLVVALDAQLLYELAGQPAEALAKIGKRPGLRASKLRGRALYDLGQHKEALIELEEALKIAPDDLEAQTWAAACKVAIESGGERDKAIEELQKLGRKAKTKSVKVVHGLALLGVGKLPEARTELEASLDAISVDQPNPLEYRARLAIAELDWREGKLASAAGQLQKALEIAPGYLPAEDISCRLLASTTEPAQARNSCRTIVNAGVASAGAELGLVKSFAPIQTAEDKQLAVEAIKRAKEKGASEEALQEAIKLLADDALWEQLGVDKPRD